ncbi:hypothetical protein F5888DRAFT_1694525 [Russula emetica]|nr:hypothetical protein F5888DRAFT_1694525 [Russula emetica]
MCSTIGYSLLSACDGCQGSDWIRAYVSAINWTKYAYNCTKTMPPGSFPNPIPAGTRLPVGSPRCHSFMLQNENNYNWNANKSYAVGGGNPLPCLPPLPRFPALPQIQPHLYL